LLVELDALTEIVAASAVPEKASLVVEMVSVNVVGESTIESVALLTV